MFGLAVDEQAWLAKLQCTFHCKAGRINTTVNHGFVL